jgi:hypothetical protein
MEKKYTALRVIGTFYKIAGVLVALGTILMVVLEVVGASAGNQYLSQYGYTGGPVVAFIGIIITFIFGGLSALGVFALGEALYLLIGLEENTRFTAIVLRDRLYPQPLPPQPMQPMPQPGVPQPGAYPPAN